MHAFQARQVKCPPPLAQVRYHKYNNGCHGINECTAEVKISLSDPISHNIGSAAGLCFSDIVVAELLKDREAFLSFEFINIAICYLRWGRISFYHGRGVKILVAATAMEPSNVPEELGINLQKGVAKKLILFCCDDVT